jgi:zinc transporter ZupT
VAAFVGQPVWAAVAGAGLALVYWGLEALTWRRARDRRDLALGLAVSGMFIRLLVVLAGLVVIGVLDRPAFATAALSFLAGFTLYVVIRPITYPPATPPAGQARLQ